MVLSGFILARGALDTRIDYASFIRNRALRVLPLMTFVYIFALYAANSKGYTLPEVISPFLFLYNTPIHFSDRTELSGAIWTISVEFQFYLVAPFLIAFVARRGIWGFVAPAMALILIMRLFAAVPIIEAPDALYRLSYFSIVGRLGQFLIGISLAYVMERTWSAPRRRAGFGLLAVSTLCVLAFLQLLNAQGGVTVWHHWRFLHHEIEGIAWAGVIGGYIVAKPLAEGLFGRSLARVGLVSFSLYIFHWPIQSVFWRAYGMSGLTVIDSIPAVFAVTIFVLLPLSLSIAALSYISVEAPFLSLRKIYLRQRAEAPLEP